MELNKLPANPETYYGLIRSSKSNLNLVNNTVINNICSAPISLKEIIRHVDGYFKLNSNRYLYFYKERTNVPLGKETTFGFVEVGREGYGRRETHYYIPELKMFRFERVGFGSVNIIETIKSAWADGFTRVISSFMYYILNQRLSCLKHIKNYPLSETLRIYRSDVGGVHSLVNTHLDILGIKSVLYIYLKITSLSLGIGDYHLAFDDIDWIDLDNRRGPSNTLNN